MAKKKGASAYNKFVAAQMKAGKTMAQAAAAWRAKTGKPKGSASKAKGSASKAKSDCKPRKKRALTPWNKFVAQHGKGSGRSLSEIAKLWRSKGKTSASTSAGKKRGKGRGRKGIARV